MQEKRKQNRKRINCAFKVVDANANDRVGCLVDLSADGFMLLSDAPVSVGSVFQLRIALGDETGGDSRYIELGAESLWCNPANKPERYWTGFHIIDISDDNENTLARLLEE